MAQCMVYYCYEVSNVTGWKLVSAALLKIFFRKRQRFSKGTREKEHVMIARKKTVFCSRTCCITDGFSHSLKPKWP